MHPYSEFIQQDVLKNSLDATGKIKMILELQPGVKFYGNYGLMNYHKFTIG